MKNSLRENASAWIARKLRSNGGQATGKEMQEWFKLTNKDIKMIREIDEI